MDLSQQKEQFSNTYVRAVVSAAGYSVYKPSVDDENDLRMEDFAIPRILIVVLVPNLLADWLQQSETELCMKHCGYWLSLRGMPDTRNTNHEIQIMLPFVYLETIYSQYQHYNPSCS